MSYVLDNRIGEGFAAMRWSCSSQKRTKSPLYSERKIGQALRNALVPAQRRKEFTQPRFIGSAEVRFRDRAIHEFSMIASMRATVCNSTRDGGLPPPDTVKVSSG